MRFQYVPYIWVLLASAAVTLSLAIYALRHKGVRGALPFGVCMFLTALWSGSYALEISGADLPTKLFWTNAQCMSYSFTPVLWLIMVFRFIERDRWVTRRNMLPLLVLPVLTVILAWTNDLHGLMWQNVHLDTQGPFPVVVKTFGPWFWLIAAYAYSLNMVSEFLLGLSLRRKSAIYREQSRALLIGLALLILQNALYIFEIHPVSRYDLTPVVAGVSGLIIAQGIFRYRLFDIVPVARENVIENMTEGLMVLDAQNRIVDMNRTAQDIFNKPFVRAIGQEAATFFAKWPALAEISNECEKLPGELVIEKNGCSRTFEVTYSFLHKLGKYNGMSIIFRDVTERKEGQAQLLRQQRALTISEERERMVRELHDSLGQVLGYINIQAQAVQEQIVRGEAETAVKALENLGQIARDSHNDVREYIQSIRGIVSAEQDFAAALQEYLKRYRQNYGIKTEVSIPDTFGMTRIEPAVGRQLLRIIQEALANVRKHACTDSVKISFAAQQEAIKVIVEDNGRGFVRSDQLDGHKFGLGIMEERAHEAGGKLYIESEPGQGTRVKVKLPCTGREG